MSFATFILTKMAEKRQRVLSIQSHVVSGYVGNKSATFPLQVKITFQWECLGEKFCFCLCAIIDFQAHILWSYSKWGYVVEYKISSTKLNWSKLSYIRVRFLYIICMYFYGHTEMSVNTILIRFLAKCSRYWDLKLTRLTLCNFPTTLATVTGRVRFWMRRNLVRPKVSGEKQRNVIWKLHYHHLLHRKFVYAH